MNTLFTLIALGVFIGIIIVILHQNNQKGRITGITRSLGISKHELMKSSSEYLIDKNISSEHLWGIFLTIDENKYLHDKTSTLHSICYCTNASELLLTKIYEKRPNNAYLLDALAQNANTPKKILRKIIKTSAKQIDYPEQLRTAKGLAASNHNCDINDVLKLLKKNSEDNWLITHCLSHKDIPLSIFHKYKDIMEDWGMQNVASKTANSKIYEFIRQQYGDEYDYDLKMNTHFNTDSDYAEYILKSDLYDWEAEAFAEKIKDIGKLRFVVKSVMNEKKDKQILEALSKILTERDSSNKKALTE